MRTDPHNGSIVPLPEVSPLIVPPEFDAKSEFTLAF